MSNGIEKGEVGEFFDDFLKEQGTYEEATERALKRVLAFRKLRMALPVSHAPKSQPRAASQLPPLKTASSEGASMTRMDSAPP